jgi:Amt family ammonium transporter
VSGFDTLGASAGFGDGVIEGEFYHLWAALIGIAAVGAYSFILTFVILKVLDLTMGIRVSEEEEELGLDVTQHGERGYTLDESGVPLGGGTVLPAPPATYTSNVPAQSAAQH